MSDYTHILEIQMEGQDNLEGYINLDTGAVSFEEGIQLTFSQLNSMSNLIASIKRLHNCCGITKLEISESEA